MRRVSPTLVDCLSGCLLLCVLSRVCRWILHQGGSSPSTLCASRRQITTTALDDGETKDLFRVPMITQTESGQFPSLCILCPTLLIEVRTPLECKVGGL
jgi:hypothetical protein